jgi:hypothetical protein
LIYLGDTFPQQKKFSSYAISVKSGAHLVSESITPRSTAIAPQRTASDTV